MDLLARGGVHHFLDRAAAAVQMKRRVFPTSLLVAAWADPAGVPSWRDDPAIVSHYADMSTTSGCADGSTNPCCTVDFVRNHFDTRNMSATATTSWQVGCLGEFSKGNGCRRRAKCGQNL